jgi:hypothetical protein
MSSDVISGLRSAIRYSLGRIGEALDPYRFSLSPDLRNLKFKNPWRHLKSEIILGIEIGGWNNIGRWVE